jgi:hypothetical protein
MGLYGALVKGVFSGKAGYFYNITCLKTTAVTARRPANPSLPVVLSTVRHFFDIDENQARDPLARVWLSKTAGLM